MEVKCQRVLLEPDNMPVAISTHPIREEWKMTPLARVAQITMGQSPPSSTYNEVGVGLPFLQGKAEFGQVSPRPVKWCSKPARIAPKHSVLVSVRAPVGDVNVAQQEYCIGRGLAAVHGHADQLDNQFAFFYLRFAKNELANQGTGSTFKSINKSVLHEFPIPLPSLPEQRRIAHVLNTIQRAIEAQDRVIEAARELKCSLMERLFTYGPYAEPAPTRETEIGEIPAHWTLVPLENLTISGFQNGLYKHASHYGSGIPILRIDAYDFGDMIDSQVLKRLRLSEEEARHYALASGDIVINRVNGNIDLLGKCALVGELSEQTVFESNVIRFTPDTKLVNNGFLLEFLCSNLSRSQIRKKARIVHQTSINQEDLKSLQIPVPDLSTQEEIADSLRAMRLKLLVEEHGKMALQSLFESMLHQLMTGQLRVTDLEL